MACVDFSPLYNPSPNTVRLIGGSLALVPIPRYYPSMHDKKPNHFQLMLGDQLGMQNKSCPGPGADSPAQIVQSRWTALQLYYQCYSV